MDPDIADLLRKALDVGTAMYTEETAENYLIHIQKQTTCVSEEGADKLWSAKGYAALITELLMSNISQSIRSHKC